MRKKSFIERTEIAKERGKDSFRARLAADRRDRLRMRLEAEKRASMLQVLFKVARMLDEQALERVSRRYGLALRRSHMNLLSQIDLDGSRIGELAERLGISKQAVSQFVDQLEGYGVLARVPDPGDSRGRRVVFTPRGREGFFSGLAVLRELERELANAIGERAMKQMHAALLAIQDRIE